MPKRPSAAAEDTSRPTKSRATGDERPSRQDRAEGVDDLQFEDPWEDEADSDGEVVDGADPDDDGPLLLSFYSMTYLFMLATGML